MHIQSLRQFPSRQIACALALTIGLSSVACVSGSGQAGSDETSGVRKVKLGELGATIYDKSELLSNIIALNNNGDVIGSYEVADESGAIFSTKQFYCQGEKFVELKQADDYTNMDVSALSDNGTIVGYVSRDMNAGPKSLVATIWDSKSGQATLLPMTDGAGTSQAQDITADGKLITGYCNGADPPHLRPCLWTRDESSGQWSVEALPTLHDFNPYTMSSSVRISPDGKTIAACCTFQFIDNMVDSSLFSWKKNFRGEWERTLLSDEQMYLHDMNNSGEMVGSIAGRGHRQPIYIAADGTITQIGLLEGDDSGEAMGITAEGWVVGVSDDPHGPEGGPQPFQWDSRSGAADSATQLSLGETPYATAVAVNDKRQVAGMADVVIVKGKTPEETLEKSLGYVTDPIQ